MIKKYIYSINTYEKNVHLHWKSDVDYLDESLKTLFETKYFIQKLILSETRFIIVLKNILWENSNG